MVRAARRALVAMLLVVAMPACKRSLMVTGTEAPATKRYAADGIAFEYPETMFIERGPKHVPLRTVMVGTDDVFAMVGWTSHAVDNAKLRERAYIFAVERVLQHAIVDGPRSGAVVSRSIGGRETEGVLVYALSGKITLVAEVYAVAVAGTSVMLLLVYPEAAAKPDRALLDVVASTLGPDLERDPNAGS